MTTTSNNIHIDLSIFTGTEAYHKLTMHPRVLFTDGLAYLAKQAKCYWLMDVVMSHLAYSRKVNQEPFVSFSITVDENKRAVCQFTDGNDKKLVKQIVESTDLPFDNLQFFCQKEEQANGTRWIVMLPSEY